MRTHLVRAASASCLSMIALAAIAATAVAAPARTVATTGHGSAERAAKPPAGAVVSHLRRVGFNAAVARAHGYRVRTAPNGTRYPVRPGARARPNDEVSGDCGDSWIYISVQGNWRSTITTGFDVDLPAIGFGWQVLRSDPYGSTTNSWGSPLAEDYSWEGSWQIQGGGPGMEYASVDPADSWALLTDGSICSSAGPNDQAMVI